MSPRRRRALPVRVASGAWQFINPALKAGRIPYARTMLVMQFIAALVFGYYTLIKKDVVLPWQSKPYYVSVILPDAKGLNPAKEPAVGVAGVPVGRVVGAKVSGGQALVRMRLDPDLKGKIFADATAFVRPTSILQTLIVNITPGNPRTGPLPDGTAIQPSNTQTFVGIDELTGVLDPDTQAQVQVLLHEASGALTGREDEIRRIFTKLGELTDGVTPLAKALAERRVLLSKLTVHLDQLFGTLGDRDQQLAAAVRLGSRTLQVTADREGPLSEGIRELAPTLAEARRALDSTGRLSGSLVPALDRLNPVAGRLAPTAEALQRLTPAFDGFLDSAEDLIDVGAVPVRQLAGGLRGQARRVREDQIPALRELGHLAGLLHDYRNGIVETAVNLSGAFSTARRAGVVGQIDVVGFDSSPAGLGLTSAQANRSTANGKTKLQRMVGRALAHACREDNTMACAMRAAGR